jgi:hypothetical protein
MQTKLLSQSLPSADAAEVRARQPDAAATRGLSVADLSRRWKVGADKVRAFLRRSELIGINVATNLSARPQWRITRESVYFVERRRSSAPPPKLPRRRKPTVVDYYPD